MGVATRVIHAAERAAVSAGADRIRLHAAPNARRLYRELGYVRGWEMRKRLLRPSRRPRPASARRRRRGR
jgi:ribosomal protein S18 acetylase RimI-like enzyme